MPQLCLKALSFTFIVQKFPITFPSLEIHGGGYKHIYHVQFQSCSFRLIFWLLLVKIHLRKEVCTEVMQYSVAQKIRKRTAWKLPGSPGRAENAIPLVPGLKGRDFASRSFMMLSSHLLLYFHLLFLVCLCLTQGKDLQACLNILLSLCSHNFFHMALFVFILLPEAV